MKMKEIVDVMEAIYYFDCLKMMMMMKKEEAPIDNDQCFETLKKINILQSDDEREGEKGSSRKKY